MLLLFADLSSQQAIQGRAQTGEADTQRRRHTALEKQAPIHGVFRRPTERFSCLAHDRPRKQLVIETKLRRSYQRPGQLAACSGPGLSTLVQPVGEVSLLLIVRRATQDSPERAIHYLAGILQGSQSGDQVLAGSQEQLLYLRIV